MSRNGQYSLFFTGAGGGVPQRHAAAMEGPPGQAADHQLNAHAGHTLQEKDGTSYIVFGCWDFYIAKLNEDMISLAETRRKILVNRKIGTGREDG